MDALKAYDTGYLKIMERQQSTTITKTVTEKGLNFAADGSISNFNTVLSTGDAHLKFLNLASREDLGISARLQNAYAQNPWVFSCIHVMRLNFSHIPLDFFDGENLMDRPEVFPQRLFEFVSPTANKFWLLDSYITWMALRGECFWQKLRGANGQPVRLKVLNPDRMQHIVKGEELIGWKRLLVNGRSELIDPADLIHFKNFNPFNEFRGFGPLLSAALGLQTDFAASQFNHNFFQRDATPSVQISTEQNLTEDEATAMELRYEKKHRGLRRSHSVSVFGKGSKLEAIAASQKDMQFFLTKKWSRDEVCTVLNVPKALLQILEDSSIKSNIKEQEKQLYNYNLIAQMVLMETGLKKDFFDAENLPGKRVRFRKEAIDGLKEEFDIKVETAVRLVSIGFSPDEVNTNQNLGFESKPDRIPLELQKIAASAGALPVTEPKNNNGKNIKNGNSDYWDLTTEEKSTRGDNERKRTQRQKAKTQGQFAKSLIEDYLNPLRQQILERIFAIDDDSKTIKKLTPDIIDEIFPDFKEANIRIVEVSRPFIAEGYTLGVGNITSQLQLNFDIGNPRALAAINTRAVELQGLNATILRKMEKKIKPIIADAITAGQSYNEAAGTIAQAARDIMNNANRNARTIAKTEINKALTQGRVDAMEGLGVLKHMWISSKNPIEPREDHAATDGEVREIGKTFSNGLTMPHEAGAPAEDVINCGCITIPFE